MVVAFSTPPAAAIDGAKLAVILCPAGAIPSGSHSEGDKSRDGEQYLCAQVMPGFMPNAYELHMWQQVIVDVTMMSKEVILEYDVATRYYYMSV